jgi:alcohol dehydrogenase class IV
VLDPSFLLTLPQTVTSTTGMDTLTHAIEAYIGRSNVGKTKKHALEAIKLVFENLENSYSNPSNITYRENMQLASYLAGVAFTRAYVGYVHALSHPISGKYNLPHGLTNAIILPYILKTYGKSIYKKMGQIYDYVNIHNGLNSDKEKCEYLISYIEEMNKRMNISNILKDVIKEEDIDFLSLHAYKEAFPLYPVPKELDINQIKIVYKQLL